VKDAKKHLRIVKDAVECIDVKNYGDKKAVKIRTR
jgi:hypothetical protein